MRPNGLPENTPWDVDLGNLAIDALSKPLAPLYEHRKRMLALDGLSLATAELDMDGNRHDRGWVHAWTGDWADFSNTNTRSKSASIDQIVAGHVSRADRLPSLEVAIDDVREPGRPLAYGANGSPLPAERSPDRVWQRLFGPSTTPNSATSKQRSAVDFAYGEYQALAPKLGVLQREKLDAHFELLHGLGNRLQGMAELQCGQAPKIPATFANYDERFDAMASLVGAAFSCDVTRVISLSLGEMPTADFGWDWLTDDVHKGLAHDVYDNPQKLQAMGDYWAKHATQMARLVSLLESLPEGDGSSIMDNTLIVWGSELADGWHGYRHYCPVLIGGSWHFRTGRYLYWPQETPIRMLTPTGYSMTSGKPHQHALVSVAQAMGVTTERVGIEHVQGQTGAYVNCSGPLEGLT
jgi:hypothetical protein